MARIPYADPVETRKAAPGLSERIVSERGNVLHLYAMLLNSPDFAEGWLVLLTAVRQRGILEGGLRELLILRVALLNGAKYESDQHRPIALAQGITEAQIAALDKWQDSGLFDPRQRAALACCDAMTVSVAVTDAVFEAARAQFTNRQLTELVVTISAYNMVSRLLVALDVQSTDDKGNWT